VVRVQRLKTSAIALLDFIARIQYAVCSLIPTYPDLPSGTLNLPIQWVWWNSFPKVKWLEIETDHSPPFSAVVKNL